MVTPFNSKGEVDYSQAKKLAQALLESGSDGLVVVGTTGESPTLTKKEEQCLFAEIKQAVGDRGAVVAGTGSNNTAEAVKATQEAEKAGVDGCLLVVPYYNKPSQEGLYQHFKTIAESTKLPCILYNVPSRTVTSLQPETVIRLSRIENIIGVKEASGDLEAIAKMISGTPADFHIWSGNDSDTFHIMNLGGYGVISVISHLVGGQVKAMLDACVKGNTAAAADIHCRLLALGDAMFVVANPTPVKYALNQLGFNVGGTRLPLVAPDEKSAAIIKEAIKNCQIDLKVG